MIAAALIDSLDEAGYFRDSLAETAERLGISEQRAAAALALIQTFDPSGIGARDLAECLAIQLREQLGGEAVVAWLTFSGATLAKLLPAWPSVVTDLNVGVVALLVNVAVLAAVSLVTRPRPEGA